MGLRKLLIISLFLITGCASQPQIITAEPAKIQVPARPELPISDLKEGDSPATVIQAHRITIKLLQGYAKELEELLKPYKK